MKSNQPEFELVQTLALYLPDVVESTVHGAPSWKLNGKLLACEAIHKSAEPKSLLVKVAPTERTRLLSTEPETFYVTDHYTSDSAILVRLPTIGRESLLGLLQNAWTFVNDSRGGRKTR